MLSVTLEVSSILKFVIYPPLVVIIAPVLLGETYAPSPTTATVAPWKVFSDFLTNMSTFSEATSYYVHVLSAFVFVDRPGF